MKVTKRTSIETSLSAQGIIETLSRTNLPDHAYLVSTNLEYGTAGILTFKWVDEE